MTPSVYALQPTAHEIGRAVHSALGWLVRCVATLMVAAATIAMADEPHEALFNEQVAPLLARRCITCHDASTKKGGLDLSSTASRATGGDSGPALQPGAADDSLMWQRIVAGEMPPQQPLIADEQAIVRRWIDEGARASIDPIDVFRYSSEQRAGYDWWSLQPVTRPPTPPVNDSSWPRNDIDAFVLARLEAAGLAPAQPADARTLLRRLYFDLIGLPPILSGDSGVVHETLLDMDVDLSSFHRDPTAYKTVVERLLASPHYGERWARHWLDVIRFGESQGFERNRIRDNAWRYRDWVIKAFNRDMPYDQFVRLQIAGDVLQPNDLDALLATGYLVCGTWDQVGHNEGSAEMQKAVRQDDLEDMVSTLGQSFLGLSIHCARCHDHKFDPISQREYYAVAALLGGVTQQEKERQDITARPSDEAYQQWVQQRDALRQQLAQLEQSLREQYETSGAREPIDGLQVLYTPEETTGDVLADQSGMGEPLNLMRGEQPPAATAAAATKLIEAAKSSNELTIETWLTPARADQTGPARIITLSLDTAQRNFTLGQDGNRYDLRFRTTNTDQNGMPSLSSPEDQAGPRKTHVVFTFDSAGKLRCYIDGRQVADRQAGGDLSNWNDEYRLAFGDELSGGRRWEGQLHLIAIYNKALSADQVARNFATESRDVRSGQPLDVLLTKVSQDERTQFVKLQESLAELERAEPAPPFHGVAHVIIPEQPPVFHVLARGDYRNPLDIVAPGGLQALSGGGLSSDFGLAPDAPEAQRRVALARWITDPHNPLTPRVLVNRLWHYHFGRGIVDTPSDFGFAGGRPTHPELLDWLAAEFQSRGWKIKDMHRLIVSSATYRQASNVRNDRAQQIDADNRLLWRANLRRLEGEAVRDAMLAVSGALNRKLAGPSYRDVHVKLGTNHEFTDPTGEFTDDVNRRTIYRLWARSGNNPMLESLDCPDPAVMVPQRSQTITPVQSLSLLNGSFVENCARRLAERAKHETSVSQSIEQQVQHVYLRAVGRRATPQELSLAEAFVEQRGLEQLCLVLLNTNEFFFVE